MLEYFDAHRRVATVDTSMYATTTEAVDDPNPWSSGDNNEASSTPNETLSGDNREDLSTRNVDNETQSGDDDDGNEESFWSRFEGVNI